MSTGGRSRAPPPCRGSSPGRRRRRSRRTCRARGEGPGGPPPLRRSRGADRPGAARVVGARPRACCCGPCGSSARWGGRAGCTRRRSPCWPRPTAVRPPPAARSCLRRAGRRSGGTARTRRRTRPRSRSTHSGIGSDAARSVGSGSSSRSATSAGSRAPDRRDSAGAWVLRSESMAVVTRARSARGTRSAASSRSRAPSSSSSSTACPAASFTVTSWRQVARRSVQPSTTNSWAPSSLGSMTASKRSLPRGRMGAADHLPLAPLPRRQRTRAARMSCPSRKTSAVMRTGRPTTALAGYPLGVDGRIPSMTMRSVTL